MITDLKGDAWASEYGKQKKLALLSYVESPVEVKVEPSTTLGVTYFTSGVQYSFQGPARVALDAQAPRVVEGKPAQPTKLGPEKAIAGGLSKDQWRRLQQATVVMRTVKPSFSVVSPDKSVVLTREPEFEWTAAGEAKRFRLVVYGPDNKILHEATTEQTALQPGSALKLEPGQRYRWKVEVLGVTTPARAVGTFTTEDEALRDKNDCQPTRRGRAACGADILCDHLGSGGLHGRRARGVEGAGARISGRSRDQTARYVISPRDS